jgi:D12 class N6 adenine-specific DNA methyltransferase
MSYGIPYMGSKQDIVASLALNFPKADHFYDLFGGGFAVTHYMLQHKSHRYKTFHYNDIRKDTVQLVKDAIAGKFSYDVFKPEWISREMFFARKDSDAYVRICWSFGNNQREYLFGEDIESYKRSLHNAIIFNDFDDTAVKVIGLKSWPREVKTVKQRKFYVRQKVAHDRKGMKRGELEQLQRLQQLERLQQLQQLERLQRLQQLQRLEMTGLSYDQVEIKPNSVVYCDIPYEGTAGYGLSFDRKAFFRWAEKQSCPIFVSEYQVNDPGFKLIYTIERNVKLAATGAKKIDDKKERLYWNGKSNGG